MNFFSRTIRIVFEEDLGRLAGHKWSESDAFATVVVVLPSRVYRSNYELFTAIYKLYGDSYLTRLIIVPGPIATGMYTGGYPAILIDIQELVRRAFGPDVNIESFKNGQQLLRDDHEDECCDGCIPLTCFNSSSRHRLVAGTFDHCHSGHYWLLLNTILKGDTLRSVSFGILVDEATTDKAHASLIQTWEDRESHIRAAVELMSFPLAPKWVDCAYSPSETPPGLGFFLASTFAMDKFRMGPVEEENLPPSDLFITDETLKGGIACCSHRSDRGWTELTLEVVQVIKSPTGPGKLSSSDLRASEILDT